MGDLVKEAYEVRDMIAEDHPEYAPLIQDIPVSVNNRMKRTIAWVRRQHRWDGSGDKCWMELNPLALGLNPEVKLDVFIHEWAHIIAGCDQGHGYKWQRICAQLGGVPSPYTQLKQRVPRARWARAAARLSLHMEANK